MDIKKKLGNCPPDLVTKGYNKMLRYEALAELTNLEEGREIVDCACGDGAEGRIIIDIFKPTKYLGVDIDKEQIKCAKLMNPVMKNSYICSDIRTPLNRQFDYYFCVETLEHLSEKDNQVVAEAISMAIKPRGQLLISVPGNPKTAMESNLHLQIITREKLIGMFNDFILEAEKRYNKHLFDVEGYSSLYIFKKRGFKFNINEKYDN